MRESSTARPVSATTSRSPTQHHRATPRLFVLVAGFGGLMSDFDAFTSTSAEFLPIGGSQLSRCPLEAEEGLPDAVSM